MKTTLGFSRMFIYSVFNGGCSTKFNDVLKCAFEGKIHPLSLWLQCSWSYELFFFFLQFLLFNKPSPFHFHLPTLPNKDPWATSEGSASIAPGLDLFAMKPVESVAAAASPTSAEPSISPTAARATPSPPTATATTAATTTTTTSATAESVALPTLDLFSGNVSAGTLPLSCFTLHYDNINLLS